MKNLFDNMKEIADKNLEAYHSDLEIDKEIMLNKENGNEFYWYVRKSGTDIYDSRKVQFVGSEDNISANYYIKYDPLLVFHIKIEKRGTKYVYGSIELIKREVFKKMITEEVKIIKEKKVKVTFNDGLIITGQFKGDDRDIINHIMVTNKKEINDLKKFKIIQYIE